MNLLGSNRPGSTRARLRSLHDLTQRSLLLACANVWCRPSTPHWHKLNPTELPPQNANQERQSHTHHFCSRFMGERKSQGKAHLQRRVGKCQEDEEAEYSWNGPCNYRIQRFWMVVMWPRKGTCFDNPRRKLWHEGGHLRFCILPLFRGYLVPILGWWFYKMFNIPCREKLKSPITK